MGTSSTPRWFASDGLAITSHDGLVSATARPGSRDAFAAAYAAGARWLQVDAALHARELVSHHSVFGRARALRSSRRGGPDPVTIHELLTSSDFAEACWNIELKSKVGLTLMLQVLADAAAVRDLGTVMISSPMRPSVLRAVAREHPDVALAAPVVHGGVFGIRFLGRRRARIGTRDYDCQQCYQRFIGRSRPNADRPVRQAWTIRSHKALQRVVDKGAAPIIDSALVEVPARGVASLRTAEPLHALPEVAVLALGGGGWRSAFGSIGAIAYLHDRGRWAGVREVAGISGGSFAVAELAGDEPDDDPTTRLVALTERLERAGGRAATVIGWAALTAVGPVAAAAGITAVVWTQRSPWGLLLVVPVIGATTFLVRVTVSLGSRQIVRSVYGKRRMRASGRVLAPSDRERRYRIGATGLNDGDLYAFTTHPTHDRLRHEADRWVPAPLGGELLADAVVRSTSLPGLGQLGFHRRRVCGHATPGEHVESCPTVPDRLVDGGISGIFGRGLVEPRVPNGIDGTPTLVAVDAGRRLPAERGRGAADRLRQIAERGSSLIHLSRWLMVAFETSYRGELARVADGRTSDGYRCVLVRLAEREVTPGTATIDHAMRTIGPERRDAVNKLTMLRHQVHAFSLTRADRAAVNRGLVAAIAACALEFEEHPQIETRLREIGARFGRADEFLRIWQGLPLLGVPTPTLDRPVFDVVDGGGGDDDGSDPRGAAEVAA